MTTFDPNQIMGNPLFGVGLGLLSEGDPYRNVMQGLQSTAGSREALEAQAAAEQQKAMNEKIAALMQQQGGQLPGSALPPPPQPQQPPPPEGGMMQLPPGMQAGVGGQMGGEMGAMPPAAGAMPQGQPNPNAGPSAQPQQQASPGKLKEALGLHLLSSGDPSMAEHGIKLLTQAIDQRQEQAEQEHFRQAIAGSSNLSEIEKFRFSTLPYDDAVAAYKKRADPESEELVEVQNPKTGEVTYMRRAQAAGQKPPEGSGEPLTQVFDPETGQTVYKRRSEAEGGVAPPRHGITIDKDGNIQIGGSSGGMQKKTRNDIEADIVQFGARKQRLSQISAGWKPDYNKIVPRVGFAWDTLKDKFGTLDPNDQQQLQEFATFQQDALANINLTIKDITGAAMSNSEAGRIRLSEPDPGEGMFGGDGPAAFKAKLDNSLYKVDLAGARLNHLLENGIEYHTGDTGGFAGISLDDMESIMDADNQRIIDSLIARGVDEPRRNGSPTSKPHRSISA